VSREIAAPPETVWALLADLSRLEGGLSASAYTAAIIATLGKAGGVSPATPRPTANH